MDNIIIYNTDDGKTNVRLYATDGTVWMTQTQIAELFDSSKQNIGQHLKHCFDERELDKNSVVKYFFTTASDGKNITPRFIALTLSWLSAFGSVPLAVFNSAAGQTLH